MSFVTHEHLIWPCSAFPIVSARKYAALSKDHTHKYEGWTDEKLEDRIITGRYGQEWARAFCKLNGLHCEEDKTPHTEPDKFDLIIGSTIFDIKTSSHSDLWPQVGAHLEGHSEAYLFLRAHKNCNGIEFVGWAYSGDVFLQENFVAQGKLLPGTKLLRQTFPNGSYFLDPYSLNNATDLYDFFIGQSLAAQAKIDTYAKPVA